jgi:von Willebrand factor type D domain
MFITLTYCPCRLFPDPHFRMYDNSMYSFHGQCDLVMAASPSFDNGLGLDLHARTEMIDQSWSLISNVALRVGDDIFEISNDKSHYFNGIKDVEFPLMMAGKYQVVFTTEDVKATNENGEEVVEQQLTYNIHLANENAIVLTNFRNMLSVNVGTYLHDTHGMLGYRSQDGMIGRDGKTVYSDPNEMGLQWQVRDFEPMLFHEIKGMQYPETCTLPLPVSDQRRRRLNQSKVSMEDAKKACENASASMLEFCVEDVVRTGDINVVHGYLGAAW